MDAVFVGYPGHFLVPFGRMLAAFRRARLVFDPLVSLLDTFAGDWALVRCAAPRLAPFGQSMRSPSASLTWCSPTRA